MNHRPNSESVSGNDARSDNWEKRRAKRIAVGLPIKVRGATKEGKSFEEVTRCINVSSGGALFFLSLPLSKGAHLELSLPLPRTLQRAVVPKAVYNTVGVVVRAESESNGKTFLVAVKFQHGSGKQYYAES